MRAKTSVMDRPRFYVRFLGGLSLQSLEATDTPLQTRFGTQKTAALLALLALLPGRALTREVLIDRLWPDATPEDGRRSLRVALTALRHLLEPVGTPAGTILTTDRDLISLRMGMVTTDIADFQNAVKRGDAEAARRVYGSGAFLPTFYDDWAIQERERIEAIHDQLPRISGRTAIAVSAPDESLPQPPALPPDPREALPFYLTRFIGRETEREHLLALCADDACRLITLTGPGGVGKTRLVHDCFVVVPRSRVLRYVPLADAYDADAFVRRVAARLDLEPGKADAVAVSDALGALGRARLVLDNLEQLLPGATSDILMHWLAACPDAQIVVTSRQKLGVPGEQAMPLEPLPTPSLPATPERLLDFASVRLFLDRTCLARPGATLTPQTADTVSALCERLGGLPLALEITAAWAGALTFRQMLTRVETHLLDEAGPPLAHKRAARPERHRTLRAALDVSLELLSPSLRQAFIALAVFGGSFTNDAAQAVLGNEAGSLETLSRLRERSLLTTDADPDASAVRFRLLPTVYEYAREWYESDEERAAILSQAHCDYFLHVAELPRIEQSHLEPDLENFRRALATAQTRDDETDLRLGIGLWEFWRVRGYNAEGLHALEAALKHHPSADSQLVLNARHAAATLAFDQSLWNDSRRHHEAALTLAHATADTLSLGRAYQGLAGLALYDGSHLTEAITLAERAQEQFRIGSHTKNEANILVGRGVIANMTGDLEAARAFQEAGLKLAQTTEDRESIARAHSRLGATLRLLECGEEAHQHQNTALALFEQIGSRLDVAYTLVNLGAIASDKKQTEEALRCYTEAYQTLLAFSEFWAVATCLSNIALLAIQKGDFPVAARHLRDGLHYRVRTGDKFSLLQSVDSVVNLLLSAAASPDTASAILQASSAVQLHAADVQLRAALGFIAVSLDDKLAARAKQVLDKATYGRLEQAGTAMNLDETIAATRAALEKFL